MSDRSYQEEIRDELKGANSRSAIRAEMGVAWTFGRWLLILAAVTIPTVFALNQFGVFSYKFFGTQREAARHDIFKESQAYQDGKVQTLARYRLQYETADPRHRKAMRTLILTEASTADMDTLPADLVAFITRLKNNPNG